MRRWIGNLIIAGLIIAGVAELQYGAAMLSRPIGFIVGGALLLAFGIFGEIAT